MLFTVFFRGVHKPQERSVTFFVNISGRDEGDWGRGLKVIMIFRYFKGRYILAISSKFDEPF